MKKLLLLAATGMLSIGSAHASLIQLNTGFGSTFVFEEFGATSLPVTSTYTHFLGAGVVTSANQLIGQPLLFSDIGSGYIGQLSPLSGSVSTVGFGDTWKLKFTYNITGFATFVDGNLSGAVCTAFPGTPGCPDGNLFGGTRNGLPIFSTNDGIAPSFTSGSFGLFYEDLLDSSNNTQVLGLSLTSTQLSPFNPGVVLNAEIDYSWYTPGSSSFVEGFITDVASGQSIYDSYMGGNASNINFRADFNVDPNYIPTCVDVACTSLSRTTNINIGGALDVPEPASLAILGAGLLGMGFVSRRRREKTAN